jgi:sugar phosphate isomerase/epimerase
MKSAVTVSLVPQAKGGPFVFWDGLPDAFAQAAALGFDAVEIFPPDAEALDVPRIRELMDQHGLKVAAVGTGGGWVIHRWHLCHPDADVRYRAAEFIFRIVERASELDAPAIIGSMQGRAEPEVPHEKALAWLWEALLDLSGDSEAHGQPLLYEPLNRYETNLFNRLADAAQFLDSSDLRSVKLLADLFHMNIEEASVPDALRAAATRIGHIHFADSNRCAVGLGHTDMAPITAALREIGYTGYLSAEVVALPDSATAARQTIESFRRYSA